MAANVNKELAPIKLDLIIAIVEKGKTSFYTDLFQIFGSNLQFVTAAKGTADTQILELLGLGEHEQNAIFALVRADRAEEMMDVLEDRFRRVKNGKGIAIDVPLSSSIGTLVYGFLTGDERITANG